MDKFKKPSRADMLDVVRPLLASADTVRDAFLGVRGLGDVARTVGLLAEAAWYPRPRWYAPLRPGDRYVATLRSGEVLAWTQYAPGEPQELMAWSSDCAGSIIWRERDA